jgi:hypothetical protein
MEADPDEGDAPIVPTATGTAEETVTGPVPVKLRMLTPAIVTLAAAPEPLFATVRGTVTLAPDTAGTPAETASCGASAVKFAATFAGAPMVKLCGLAVPVTAPEKFANVYPAFGAAVTVSSEPAL